MEKISQWPLQERPREKLLLCGAGRLSDAELLAVILGRGSSGRSALSIARHLVNKFGSLHGIANASREELLSIGGVGHAFYATLQSAIEIMRRQLAEPLKRESVFSRVDDTRQYLIAMLKDQPRELFGLLMLDSQHQLLFFREMFQGTINAAAVYPRELVKQVLADNAAAIILVHNHPSGVAEPSQADIHLTRDVKAAMALIDVAVLDHFIVGGTQVSSLAQRGYV